MIKKKIKKVVAEVNVEEIYHADTKCPYCGEGNDSEVERDNITLIEKCRKCGKEYKMKIPKDSF